MLEVGYDALEGDENKALIELQKTLEARKKHMITLPKPFWKWRACLVIRF